MANKDSTLGIQYDKLEDTNAWYTEVITKSGLIEYTDVSGCYILRPKAQYIWDTIRNYMDKKLRARGVRNASFPLFIPEHLLMKEKEHVEGFSPEVAWVTHAGNSKLAERLAVRPTSETIMYPAYAKWIRSYNDLPLKLNQWCSVVRWEFKHPMPFLRSREFHWQEGHTAFATQEEAKAEATDILLNVYKKTYEELLAIPSLAGYKSEKEKFAGAVRTLSLEMFLPIGKAIQGCTTHYLGQNFSKPFNIIFLDKDQKKKHPHQNSWGFSTRSIGIMVMMHSDSRGLVLPPKVAEHKVIIIPIFTKSNRDEILKYALSIKKKLSKFNPILDAREQYSVGWKLNEAELNGVPIRIEVGKRELADKSVTLVRRDTLEKQSVSIRRLERRVKDELQAMHQNLFKRAEQFLESSIVEETKELKKIVAYVKAKRVVKTVYDGARETDEIIKEKTGAKTLVIPFKEKLKQGLRCPFSGNPAKHVVYIARSL
ncbi:proline--tRNA ligase [Candidatus Woesearchaeota archaeon]|nr:proline--tRNA ligase [Candidatus Woesearchaeota archaeon]